MTDRLCVWDLDGTLVDSLRDIAEAANDALELLGLPTRPVEDYRYLVGEGVPRLCSRLLGDQHPELLGRLIELTRARYRARPLVHTRPYPGVPEAIDRLRAAGWKLAVLSNKPHRLTLRVVRAFWRDAFARIQGYTTEALRKPDPTQLLHLCDTLGIPPHHAVLVGDTPTDIETGRRAGVRTIGITWGFRTRDDLTAAGAREIADTPAGLVRRLLDPHGGPASGSASAGQQSDASAR